MNSRRIVLLASFCWLLAAVGVQAQPAAGPTFEWPEGKRAALSLSFDDARLSQVDVGLDVFARHGARATFYLNPPTVLQRLDGWRRAAAEGHEIANHSVTHPCSGNFPWARERALEDFTLDRIRFELTETNRLLDSLLGVVPATFAYPCGQKFVGRGRGVQSYVPVAAELFVAARGFLDEAPNDPSYCDLAQLTGVNMDAQDFDALLPLIQQTQRDGMWLVLAGHEIGTAGRQTTRVAMLEDLLRYAQDPANGIWLAPVDEVARYVRDHRSIDAE